MSTCFILLRLFLFCMYVSLCIYGHVAFDIGCVGCGSIEYVHWRIAIWLGWDMFGFSNYLFKFHEPWRHYSTQHYFSLSLTYRHYFLFIADWKLFLLLRVNCKKYENTFIKCLTLFLFMYLSKAGNASVGVLNVLLEQFYLPHFKRGL